MASTRKLTIAAERVVESQRMPTCPGADCDCPILRAKCLHGDAESKEFLAKRLKPFAESTVRWAVSDWNGVGEDIASESLLLAFRELGTWKGSGSLCKWVKKIAAMRVITYRRSKASQRGPIDGGQERVDYRSNAEAARAWREMHACMDSVAKALPSDLKQIYDMHYSNQSGELSVEMSPEAIADVLGLSERTIQVELKKIRKKILDKCKSFWELWLQLRDKSS